ncbi:MAG TPA: hypothetical protein VII38_01765, partial [Polyangia bacterium]
RYDVATATVENPLIAYVHLAADDDLHLLDSAGQPPSASMKVEGVPATVSSLPAHLPRLRLE